MKCWLSALVAIFCTGSALALGLGEVEGRATIGRPLQLAIAILGADAAAQGDCASLLPEGEAEGRDSIQIKVVGDRIHLTTQRGLTQPILQFRIRLGCSAPMERSFTVLADPPERVATLPVAATAPPAPAVRPLALPRTEPVAPRESGIVLEAATTARLLSRQRYPGNSRLRVSFIRKLAAANPELFASEDAAFDQRLAAGTRLRLPADMPAPQPASATRRAGTGSSAAAPPRAAKPSRVGGGTARPADTGRGRLIVGAAGLSSKGGPSAAELNESIDRLIEVMNQQVAVQMALTERIKAAEADVAELKRLVQAEKLRTAQLESELKAAREQVERGDTIQLVLSILLAGVVGGWVLNWTARRRAATAELSPIVAVAPAPTPAPTPAARQRPLAMPSAFDDLLAPFDDRPPPGGVR